MGKKDVMMPKLKNKGLRALPTKLWYSLIKV